jgi:hypothetical protein
MTLRRSRSRLVVTLASALAAIALASACADEEIVLAKLPRSPDGRMPAELIRCTDTKECPAKAFCTKSACGDVGGVCEPRPVVCEEEPRPVCGCDGVTYWNDCLRRAAGVSALREGECAETALTCGARGGDPTRPPPPPGPMDPQPAPDPFGGCPSGALCARLLPFGADGPLGPNDCPPDVPGTCWALPAVCPGDRTGADRWTACGELAPRCATTCDAIRSGVPHKRAKACP